MKKLKHKHYYDPTYRVHYVFLLNVKNDKEVDKILKRNYKETYKFYKRENTDGSCTLEGCGGKCIQSTHRQIIMVRKMKYYQAPYWYATLAHECLHSVLNIFHHRGVDGFNGGCNEHMTYYLDCLVTQALE